MKVDRSKQSRKFDFTIIMLLRIDLKQIYRYCFMLDKSQLCGKANMFCNSFSQDKANLINLMFFIKIL